MVKYEPFIDTLIEPILDKLLWPQDQDTVEALPDNALGSIEGLQLWVDMKDSNLISVDGSNNVTNVKAAYGGLNFSPAGGQSPTYSSRTTHKGATVVEFNGANGLGSAENVDIQKWAGDNDKDVTVFVSVISDSTTAQAQYLMTHDSTSFPQELTMNYDDTLGNIKFDFGGRLQSSLVSDIGKTKQRLIMFRREGDTFNVSINGTQVDNGGSSFVPLDSNLAKFYLAGLSNGSQALDGFIADLVIYNRAITQLSEVNTIAKFLVDVGWNSSGFFDDGQGFYQRDTEYNFLDSNATGPTGDNLVLGSDNLILGADNLIT